MLVFRMTRLKCSFISLQTNSRLNSQPTRQQSEDMIHNQLAAFERLLLHAMSRFSKDNLYYMLRHVARWAQNKQQESSQKGMVAVYKLKSIQQLKECVVSMKEMRIHKSVEDDHVYKNYDLFLNDLHYLKDLKKYFDDEIYKSLMTYHYEPDIGKNKAQSEKKTKIPHLLKTRGKARYVSHGTEDDDSGHGSQVESGDAIKTTPRDRNKRKNGTVASDNKAVTSDAETRYRNTVSDLQDILQKWNGLLSEEPLDLDDFDPDSYHELMQFANYSQFEPILRLVPDIFAKCYKCIDLAKVWLRESNIVLKDIPLTNTLTITGDDTKQDDKIEEQNTPREFMKAYRDIKSQLSDIETSIENDERKLEQYKREMSQLTNRDDRFSRLSSEFVKMDSLITLAAGDYQKSKTEQYGVATKLRGCPRDSYDYIELKEKLRKIDKEVSENHWKMKLLEFEKAMVEEDYVVESGVRPSFIRFLGDTKDKMQDLQEDVQSKKEDKLKLNKQLALMRTNTDRTKTIMRTYLGSAETRAGPSIDREVTLSSQASDIQDVSEEIFEDGNEADVDSAGPYDNSPGRYESVDFLPVNSNSESGDDRKTKDIERKRMESNRYESINSIPPMPDTHNPSSKRYESVKSSSSEDSLKGLRNKTKHAETYSADSSKGLRNKTKHPEHYSKQLDRYEDIETLDKEINAKKKTSTDMQTNIPFSKRPIRHKSNNLTPRGNTLILSKGISSAATVSENRYEAIKSPFSEINSNNDTEKRPPSFRSDTSDRKGNTLRDQSGITKMKTKKSGFY